jgi:transcriptional regulator with XRE-family HTH domain
MIYPVQIRAARSLLGLSQDELARGAQVSIVTVKRLEAAGTEIRGSAQTIARLQRALEAAGIIFIDQDAKVGPGVRLKQPLD